MNSIPSTTLLELKDILRELLQKNAISATELARRIDLPQPTIHRIATGAHKKPKIYTLQRIANYFNITVNQLCGADPLLHLVSSKKALVSIPVLNFNQILSNAYSTEEITNHIICDNALSDKSFAMYMPDSSMEPMIPEGSTLLIDCERAANHGDFVVYKPHRPKQLLIRKLINSHTLKSVNIDFNQNNYQIQKEDIIIGVIVEVRFNSV